MKGIGSCNVIVQLSTSIRRGAALRVIAAVCALGAAGPVHASLTEVALVPGRYYLQSTSAAPTAPYEYWILVGYGQTAGEFTSATLTYPGASSPQTLPTSGTFPEFGAEFSTAAAFQTAYPFGTYTFHLSNGGTVATESVDYSQNLFPTAISALTAASFNLLQGVNPAMPLTVDFDSFTAPAGATGAGTELEIYNSMTDVLVYNSGFLSDSATSVVIPSNTLYAGTQYQVSLESDVQDDTTDSSTGVALDQFFNSFTYVNFTTASLATYNSLQGGSSSSPTLLFSGQSTSSPVSEITGTIGGSGTEQYYEFYWGGGAFTADLSISGANSGASYLFSEGVAGTCSSGGTATLDSADSFTGSIAIASQAAGDYCIGVDANNSSDPGFTLTFTTPVSSFASPEPSSFILFPAGLGMIGFLRYARGKRKGDRRHSLPV